MATVEQLKRAQREATTKKQELDEVRNRRQTRERELETAREQLKEVRTEAKARELVPAGAAEQDAAKSAAEEKAEQLESTIADLQQEEARAEDEWKEARKRVTEIAKELAPDLAQDVAEAKQEQINALRRLGEDVIRRFADEVVPARGEKKEKVAALQQVLPSLKQGAEPGDERRLAKRQQRELERWIEDASRGVSAEARLGFLVVEVVNWASRHSSPVPELWDDLDVDRQDGSTLNRRPVGAPQELVAKMREGNLPI